MKFIFIFLNIKNGCQKRHLKCKTIHLLRFRFSLDFNISTFKKSKIKNRGLLDRYTEFV